MLPDTHTNTHTRHTLTMYIYMMSSYISFIWIRFPT